MEEEVSFTSGSFGKRRGDGIFGDVDAINWGYREAKMVYSTAVCGPWSTLNILLNAVVHGEKFFTTFTFNIDSLNKALEGVEGWENVNTEAYK
jgi:hypothetical protein